LEEEFFYSFMKNILDTTTIFIMQYLNSQTTHKRVFTEKPINHAYRRCIVCRIHHPNYFKHAFNSSLKNLSLNHVLFNALIAFIVEIDNAYY
jgi:hypothetical protein